MPHEHTTTAKDEETTEINTIHNSKYENTYDAILCLHLQNSYKPTKQSVFTSLPKFASVQINSNIFDVRDFLDLETYRGHCNMIHQFVEKTNLDNLVQRISGTWNWPNIPGLWWPFLSPAIVVKHCQQIECSLSMPHCTSCIRYKQFNDYFWLNPTEKIIAKILVSSNTRPHVNRHTYKLMLTPQVMHFATLSFDIDLHNHNTMSTATQH